MSTDYQLTDSADPEETLGDLLTYAELLNTPQLARLYIYVLRNGPIAIEAVKENLDIPHSTAYKYVGELEEMGILARHQDETPTRISVKPIHLTLDTNHGDAVATPVLVDAIGRQLENEDIRVFVERQGIPKLAAALHYTLRVMNGEMTQRTAANKLDVHPVEGTTIITALQEVVDEAVAYDPSLEP
jgi:hypothetical protein